MKKIRNIIAILLASSMIFAMPVSADEKIAEKPEIEYSSSKEYYEKFKNDKISINVYNWGEYIPDGSDGTLDINAEFERITGIKVNYSTFATNEEMYAKLKGSSSAYDIIIPSDYMVARMIEEDMVEPLDKSNIPNAEFVMDNFKNLSYDDGNNYSIPYSWGTIVIFYNKEMVDPEDDMETWKVFWNEKYKNDILMFSNPRDAFGIAQKILGYSYNSDNKEEWQEALEMMQKEKELVHGYVMDEIFDKMAGGEAAIAPYYAGDGKMLMDDNDEIDFAFPVEGTNMFVDAVCIPKGSKQKEAAEMYINFLSEPEIALEISEYLGYATANSKAFDLLDDETKNNELFYPSDEIIKNSEIYENLSPEMNDYIQTLWEDLKSYSPGSAEQNEMLVAVLLFLGIILLIAINIIRSRKRKRREQY